MRGTYLFATLVFLVFVQAYTLAQKDSLHLNQKEYILKFPVSSILGDLRTNSLGFSLGIESVGNNGWSFSQELGYMFDVPGENVFSEGSSDDELNGIRITSELRKYLFSKNLNPSSGLFLSAEWDNKLTRASYFLLGERNYSNAYRSSLTLNIGMKVFWNPDKLGRFTLELMIGGGCEYLDADQDSYVFETGLLFPNESLYPWVNFDIKLGYLLGKRESEQ